MILEKIWRKIYLKICITDNSSERGSGMYAIKGFVKDGSISDIERNISNALSDGNTKVHCHIKSVDFEHSESEVKLEIILSAEKVSA